ncbi:MAG TPA: ribonuclease P protein component [Actinomycetota bacterium]|nr:ribonuclease P protein component [Actinomycetota bacterium]
MISNSRDVTRVYELGRRARKDGVVAIAASRPEGGEARAALAVPARVGSAPVRNRIRRRLRAVLREWDLPAGFDVVLQADSSVAEADYQELVNNVKAAVTSAVEAQ